MGETVEMDGAGTEQRHATPIFPAGQIERVPPGPQQGMSGLMSSSWNLPLTFSVIMEAPFSFRLTESPQGPYSLRSYANQISWAPIRHTSESGLNIFHGT